MKWNGSIYYNVISQDNVGVDRAALMQAACPVPPSSLPEALGTHSNRENQLGHGIT